MIGRVVLREAVADDVPALVDVQRQGALLALGHIFPQEDHPFPTELITERWLAEVAEPSTTVYVSSDDRITGFAATRGDELVHFGTAPDTWGSGLASELLAEVVRVAAGRGRPLTRLWVFEENTRARRFYEKHGWQQSGARSRGTTPPHPPLVEYRVRTAGARSTVPGSP